MQARRALDSARLDTSLRAILDDPAPQPQRVIIRVRPGSRAALGRSLTDHGDRILVEHDSLDALTAVVHAEDLAELAHNDAILSVSADAIVRPSGVLEGLLRLVGGVANGLVEVVGNVLSAERRGHVGPASSSSGIAVDAWRG